MQSIVSKVTSSVASRGSAARCGTSYTSRSIRLLSSSSAITTTKAESSSSAPPLLRSSCVHENPPSSSSSSSKLLLTHSTRRSFSSSVSTGSSSSSNSTNRHNPSITVRRQQQEQQGGLLLSKQDYYEKVTEQIHELLEERSSTLWTNHDIPQVRHIFHTMLHDMLQQQQQQYDNQTMIIQLEMIRNLTQLLKRWFMERQSLNPSLMKSLDITYYIHGILKVWQIVGNDHDQQDIQKEALESTMEILRIYHTIQEELWNHKDEFIQKFKPYSTMTKDGDEEDQQQTNHHHDTTADIMFQKKFGPLLPLEDRSYMVALKTLGKFGNHYSPKEYCEMVQELLQQGVLAHEQLSKLFMNDQQNNDDSPPSFSSDLRLWNAALWTLSLKKDISCMELAQDLFEEMTTTTNENEGFGLVPEIHTYYSLIHGWAKVTSRTNPDHALKAQEWLDHALEHLETEEENDNSNYKDNNHHYYQHHHHHNTITDLYTACIDAWARTNSVEGANKAEELLKRMIQNKLSIASSPTLLTQVLKAWAWSGHEDAGPKAQAIWTLVHSLQLEQQQQHLLGEGDDDYDDDDEEDYDDDDETPNAVMQRRQQQQQPDHHYFEPTLTAYNTLMDAWSRGGHVDKVVSLMEEMKTKESRSLQPNDFSYLLLLRALEKSSKLDGASKAESLLEKLLNQQEEEEEHERSIIEVSAAMFKSVLFAWIKRSKQMEDAPERARNVLQRWKEWATTEDMHDIENTENLPAKRRRKRNHSICHPPDQVAYHAILKCLAERGDYTRSISLLLDMEGNDHDSNNKNNVQPNIATYWFLLHATVNSKRDDSAEKAMLLLDRMQDKAKIIPNRNIYTEVITAFANGKVVTLEQAQAAENMLFAMQHEYEQQQEQQKENEDTVDNEKDNSNDANNNNNIKPDSITVDRVLQVWSKCDSDVAPEKARSLVEWAELEYNEKNNMDMKPIRSWYNSLLSTWSTATVRKERLREMQIIIRFMADDQDSSIHPDVQSYNHVIKTMLKTGEKRAAAMCFKTLKLMCERTRKQEEEDFETCLVRPNRESFEMVLEAVEAVPKRERKTTGHDAVEFLAEELGAEEDQLLFEPTASTYQKLFRVAGLVKYDKLNVLEKALTVAVKKNMVSQAVIDTFQKVRLDVEIRQARAEGGGGPPPPEFDEMNDPDFMGYPASMWGKDREENNFLTNIGQT